MSVLSENPTQKQSLEMRDKKYSSSKQSKQLDKILFTLFTIRQF